MIDPMGDRFKGYEEATQTTLMGRSNLFVRTDGRAFHSYTRECQRPFDDQLMSAMDETAIALCEEIQGAKLGYVQSDEISIWATGYDKIGTDTWFGGNTQKIVSIAASVATARFNQVRHQQMVTQAISEDVQEIEHESISLAHFDARAFLVPDLYEVTNAFKWRADDCSRNSIQMLARSLYSHRELEGKSTSNLHELIHFKGQNWNDLAPKYKRGRLIKRIDMRWKVVDLTDFTFDYWMGIVQNVAPKI